MGNSFKNRAKSTADGCDSICPNNSDNGNAFKGYKGSELLADTIHFLKGEVVQDKKVDNLEEKLSHEIENQVYFKNDDLKRIFSDVITSFYFEKGNDVKNAINIVKPENFDYFCAKRGVDFGTGGQAFQFKNIAYFSRFGFLKISF